jgi:hypothetical protein
MINKILYYLTCAILSCLVFATGLAVGITIIVSWQEALLGFAIGFGLITIAHFLYTTAIKLKK